MRFIVGLSFLRTPTAVGSNASDGDSALAAGIPIGASTGNAGAPASGAHVYLLRAACSIFSLLGLDDIAAKLQQQGINVTVANYLSWASLADEAAAEYKSGRTKTIILVGHSSGAPRAALYGGAPGLPWCPLVEVGDLVCI